MKNTALLYGIIGLLAGSLLTVLLTTNIVNSNNAGMMQIMGIRQNTNSSMASSLDRHFIEQMIPHHEGAIEMAKLAQEKSTGSEIQTLARAIIDSQSKEIDQMKTWYKNWYEANVPVNFGVGMGMGRGMMHGGMMGGDTADIESLKSASDFDKAFLEEMIPHHQIAVMMAQMLLSGTNRSEMKKLAKDIIDAQEAEIEQMRAWLQN